MRNVYSTSFIYFCTRNHPVTESARSSSAILYKFNNLLEYIFIIAWLMLAGVSNMAYFADENQNHNNSGRFFVNIIYVEGY